MNKEKRNFIIFTVIAVVIAGGVIAGAILLNRPSDSEPAEIFTEKTTVAQTTTKVTVTTAEAVFPLDLNTAEKSELIQLEGIGEVLAERIIAYRSEKPFGSKEEIMLVGGVGNVVFNKIKDFITVSASETSFAEAVTTSVPVHTTKTPHVTTAVQTAVESATAVTTTAPPVTTTEITTITTTETTAYVPELPIDINSASLADFMYLDGIGESLARRIISYRGQVGGFYDVYELRNVSGIGEKLLNSMLPYIWADASRLPPKTTATEPQTLPPVTTTTTVATTTAVPEPPAIININTAGVAEFASLPGMNVALAENIVKLRESIGGSFSSVYEILYADGMTDGIFNKILPYITI